MAVQDITQAKLRRGVAASLWGVLGVFGVCGANRDSMLRMLPRLWCPCGLGLGWGSQSVSHRVSGGRMVSMRWYLQESLVVLNALRCRNSSASKLAMHPAYTQAVGLGCCSTCLSIYSYCSVIGDGGR